MHEHELWFTALLNQYFAGPANALIALAGQGSLNQLLNGSRLIPRRFLV